MRFWYQLSQDSQLSVFLRTPVDGDLQSLHNSKPFKSTMQWTKANVLLRNITGDEIVGPFQVSPLPAPRYKCTQVVICCWYSSLQNNFKTLTITM